MRELRRQWRGRRNPDGTVETVAGSGWTLRAIWFEGGEIGPAFKPIRIRLEDIAIDRYCDFYFTDHNRKTAETLWRDFVTGKVNHRGSKIKSS